VKKWMASINAYKLDRQRHSRQFQKLLKEIKERNSWTAKQFRDYQCRQLQVLIQNAARYVPYYRDLFYKLSIDPGSIKDLDDLAKLPILEKDIVRCDPESLLDERYNKKKLIVAHTSGTTGTPLSLYRNIWLNSVAFAYNEIRCHGVVSMQRRVNRSVSIGGHIIAAPTRRKPPFWVLNRRWKQLYMSSYHLLPQYLDYYVEKLREFKGEYIEGYPSSVAAVAKHIVDNNLDPVFFKACFTTAETLVDYQRELIQKAFCCKTYSQYGCGELVVFAAECPRGSMHLSPEVGIVEVVDDDDKPVPKGNSGHLICTSLVNSVQPFIRYRVGDIGALAQHDNCPCGSQLPILESIEGRESDVLYSPEKGRVGSAALSTALYKIAGRFTASQIEQVGRNRFIFRYVPKDKILDKEEKAVILGELHSRLGFSTDILIEETTEIKRTAAGKFKLVICSLPAEVKQSL